VALAVGLMPMADLFQMLQVETVYIPELGGLYRGMTSWVTRLIQAFMLLEMQEVLRKLPLQA